MTKTNNKKTSTRHLKNSINLLKRRMNQIRVSGTVQTFNNQASIEKGRLQCRLTELTRMLFAAQSQESFYAPAPAYA